MIKIHSSKSENLSYNLYLFVLLVTKYSIHCKHLQATVTRFLIPFKIQGPFWMSSAMTVKREIKEADMEMEKCNKYRRSNTLYKGFLNDLMSMEMMCVICFGLHSNQISTQLNATALICTSIWGFLKSNK